MRLQQPVRRRRAFSLVELMIVLAVLSILAAAVIPRLGSASDTARGTNARAQILTLRQQLELWRIDHGGQYPTLLELQRGPRHWAVFTHTTRFDGTIDPTGAHGPYFAHEPANPYTHSTLVTAAPISPHAGWVYDEHTGMLKVILPQSVDPATTDLAPGDYVRH